MAVHETGTLLRLNLTPTLLGGEGHLRSRFLAAAALLHHPNVVSHVQSVYVEGVTCVLTEYMPAGNLQSLIDVTTQAAGSSGPISPSTHSISKSGGTMCVPWQVCKRLTLDIARGLAYLHSQSPPFIHCGLSPFTVMLTATGLAKLDDLGTEGYRNDPAFAKSMRKRTPWHAAPETANGGAFTQASDVYSFGVTVLHLLLGCAPYRHLGATDGEREAAYMQLYESCDESLRPEVPEWIDDSLRGVLVQCIERDPDLRPSAAKVLALLEFPA